MTVLFPVIILLLFSLYDAEVTGFFGYGIRIRFCAILTAELNTMKVIEQIDALCYARDKFVRFLAVPEFCCYIFNGIYFDFKKLAMIV
jgi:hypothetical protein